MSIWKREVRIGAVVAADRPARPDTLGGHIGLQLVEIGKDFLRGSLPVDERTHQPFGLLHGGASCVLAEELGSIAANLCLEDPQDVAVGLEINANHVRSVRSGTVTGTARPLHVGRRTQVWDIRIEDEAGKLICIARLTVAVRRRDGAG